MLAAKVEQDLGHDESRWFNSDGYESVAHARQVERQTSARLNDTGGRVHVCLGGRAVDRGQHGRDRQQGSEHRPAGGKFSEPWWNHASRKGRPRLERRLQVDHRDVCVLRPLHLLAQPGNLLGGQPLGIHPTPATVEWEQFRLVLQHRHRTQPAPPPRPGETRRTRRRARPLSSSK